MVAQTIALPNLRKMFIPDPGYMIVDADLSGADAQVVAWEADDEDLKTAFRAGMKVHIKNARDVYPEIVGDLTDEQLKATDKPGGIYHNCKRRVHATNYGGSARTLAITLKTSLSEEERFQRAWFHLHPGIKEWQDRTDHQIQTTRTVRNRFGYRRVYFDRVERLLPEGLAWIPQSTVALVCDRGLLQIEAAFPWLEILLQNHDSGVFQIPIHREDWLDRIHKELHNEVPYSDPLVIPWGMSSSRQSWGDCK